MCVCVGGGGVGVTMQSSVRASLQLPLIRLACSANLTVHRDTFQYLVAVVFLLYEGCGGGHCSLVDVDGDMGLLCPLNIASPREELFFTYSTIQRLSDDRLTEQFIDFLTVNSSISDGASLIIQYCTH